MISWDAIFAAEGRIRKWDAIFAAEGRIRKWDAIFAAEGLIGKWDVIFINLLRRQESKHILKLLGNTPKYWENVSTP